MTDEQEVVKKDGKQKSYPKVVNVLKGSVSTINITKQILNIGVNFIDEEYLDLALKVEKEFTKAMSKDEDIRLMVSTIDLPSS